MKKLTLLLTFSLIVHVIQAQVIARITVETGRYRRTNIPLNCEVPVSESDRYQLKEIKGKQHNPIPFQTGPHQIYWLLDGVNLPNTRRIFELVKLDPAMLATMQERPVKPAMQAIDSSGSLILKADNHHLLQYNYATVYPPKGADTVYKRSGFIHPLWSPNGQILTNIHPKDHLHHVGIWNPWTHTEYEGKETDFWNLQKKEGTVQFTSFISQTNGDIWTGFKALQDHITNNKTALHEIWDVRVYATGTDTLRRIWDFTSTLSCADSPLQLLQYRYGGGFAFRATADWNAKTSKVLTSSGKTRSNADSTRARWIKISGPTAGILILSAPDNYDSPQPLRVWPENTERGEMMMNYSPTKMNPWNLEPGKEYGQRYRIMVFENDITAVEAENAWQAFAHPPVIKVSSSL